MAITYDLLLDADFAPLGNAGASWLQLYEILGDQAAALVNLKSNDHSAFGVDHWEGETGETAREHVRHLVLALDERAAAARRVSVAITDAIEEFEGARADLNEVVAEIDHERVVLSGDGTLTPDNSQGTDNTPYAEGLAERIAAALERATEADEALRAAVGVWAETLSESERLGLIHEATDEAEELQDLVDSGAAPEAINDWWSGLDEAERLGILEGRPELVATLDGIPTDTRDAANRDLLATAIDRYSPTLDADIADLRAQIAALEESGEQYAYSENGVPHHSAEYADLLARLEGLEGQRGDRDALTDLQDATAGPAPTGQEHFLLGFDTEDDGGAIVSIGNPDTAANTGIFVPGTFSALDNFTGEGGALERATAMARDARQYGVPGEETAMIAWLDYDSPQSADPRNAFEANTWDLGAILPEANDGSRAEEGAQTLNRFIDGLDAAHRDGGAHTTLAGHSYGGLVVGETVQDTDTGADQIIGVAAPGFGVDRAAELAIGEENVWATMAEGDAIDGAAAESVVHGNDPTNDAFGGRTFDSDASGADGGDVHGGYWDEGNDARKNMALIVTGQTELVEPPGGRP
jgi:hypothetical protein